MVKKRKEDCQDEKCPICLEEINGDIIITKCKHIFHYKCFLLTKKKKTTRDI